MEKDKSASAISNKPRMPSANSKSDLIKSLPIELPVRDVIRSAREVGFEVSKAYVHEIRASMRKTLSMGSSLASSQEVSQVVAKSDDTLQAAFAFASAQPTKTIPDTGPADLVSPVPSARSKREYIMAIALDVPVRQVLEDAHKAGFPVSKAYVHEVRSRLREKAKAEQKDAKVKASKAKPFVDELSKNTDAKREGAFRKLVIELGTSRARSLLDQVERKLNALILDD